MPQEQARGGEGFLMLIPRFLAAHFVSKLPVPCLLSSATSEFGHCNLLHLSWNLAAYSRRLGNFKPRLSSN